MIATLIGLALQSAAAPPRSKIVFEEPPLAREVTGEIQAVMLSPLFRKPFMCSEHHHGQMPHAGDALGTDCMVTGGIDPKGQGFSGLYRTDGRSNEDWYGWGAGVLAPFDGVVTAYFPKDSVNAPGTVGRPPAAMLRIQRSDGTIALLGHVAQVSVSVGDRVKAGQAIARVGNNGISRAPHIHIGAYRGDMPLQIRWDQRAMARLFREGAGK
jgi:hypothetical protein